MNHGMSQGAVGMRPGVSLALTLLLVLALPVAVFATSATAARGRVREEPTPRASDVQEAPQRRDVNAGDVAPPLDAGIELQPGLRGGGHRRLSAPGVGDRLLEHGQGEDAVGSVFVVCRRLPGGESCQFEGARRTVLRSTQLKATSAMSW
jgi:hypothetical protein